MVAELGSAQPQVVFSFYPTFPPIYLNLRSLSKLILNHLNINQENVENLSAKHSGIRVVRISD